ncbi:MAG: hypothetical protein HY775_01785 [Acidobacteria bacterium]|nr:hypothetical protein [Acidobacteriota bacterium]
MKLIVTAALGLGALLGALFLIGVLRSGLTQVGPFALTYFVLYVVGAGYLLSQIWRRERRR